MIPLQTEQVITLTQARKLHWLRGRAGQLDIGTLRRWCLRGFKGILLETTKIGGTTYTSVEAIERFIEAVNAVRAASSPPTNARDQQLRQAEKILDNAQIS